MSSRSPSLPTLEEIVMRDMQTWLERAVIGLNLCPFAKAVHVKGQIHYAVSRASDPPELLQALRYELEGLQASDPVQRDTTLLIMPCGLQDFFDFNDLMGQADQLVSDLDLEGVIQIASFHPQFQFAGTRVDDISNYTNRAPYPTLHLLREGSVERAVDAFPDAELIFGKNIVTLEHLGHSGWAALDLNAKAVQPPVDQTHDARRGKIKP
jgi:uncharacterized protein